MTEGTPDERRPSRLNEEDEPEVEGHRFHGPSEVPADAERRPRLNEDDEAGDEHGRRR
jgi:hypothetical protein